MSAQILGDKWTRRCAAATGQDVVRVWGHADPQWFAFVTRDHRHGWWSKRTDEWHWDNKPGLAHYSSCRTMFPGYDSPTTAA